MTKRELVAFLVGALTGKLILRESNCKLRGLVLCFPETKAWLVKRLKTVFGGCMYIRKNAHTVSVGYLLTAKKDKAQLLTVLQKYQAELPELSPLISLLRAPCTEISVKNKRRRKENLPPPVHQNEEVN